MERQNKTTKDSYTMKNGLALGKFMPFHYGHAALMNFALEHADTLTVLVCANENEPIPGSTRRNWVSNHFVNDPRVKVVLIDYDDALLSASSVSSKEASAQWAAFLKEKFPDINLFISSEPYGEYVALYWQIDHLSFDEKRTMVPVSATDIRNQPFRNWHYIPPAVRPYFAKKICLIGSESTGKSVLTERLAGYYETVFVPEMARAVIGETNSCTPADLQSIAQLHAKTIIETLPLANKLLFVDTDINITRSYAAFLFNTTLSTADWVNEANQFDLYLFLETDIPYVQDGTRLNEADREKLNAFHKNEFARQRIHYYTVSGDWEQRFKTAIQIIDKAFFTV